MRIYSTGLDGQVANGLGIAGGSGLDFVLVLFQFDGKLLI